LGAKVGSLLSDNYLLPTITAGRPGSSDVYVSFPSSRVLGRQEQAIIERAFAKV